jgi:hypothetical protein
MAGYSGTPLARKLGIKAGARIGLVRPPAGFEGTLGELPAGVSAQLVGRGKQTFDVMICFTTREAELARDLPALKQRMTPAAGLWMSWPKKASGVATELDGNLIRARGLAAGLVDNKVCAIDETWSGLRFVIRLVDRAQAGATRLAKAGATRPTKAGAKRHG